MVLASLLLPSSPRAARNSNGGSRAKTQTGAERHCAKNQADFYEKISGQQSTNSANHAKQAYSECREGDPSCVLQRDKKQERSFEVSIQRSLMFLRIEPNMDLRLRRLHGLFTGTNFA